MASEYKWSAAPNSFRGLVRTRVNPTNESIIQSSPTLMNVGFHEDDEPYKPVTSAFRNVSYTPSQHNEGGFTISAPSQPPYWQDYADVVSQKTLHLVAERRNERLGRVLKVTQSDLPFIGTNSIETEIEVHETSHSKESITIFSVKHTHSGLWGRQMVVHKNLLLACKIAGVQLPLDVPAESVRLFNQLDSASNIHNYMERILRFVKTKHVALGVTIYWWRAIGNGSVVVQNNTTGKVLFFINDEDRSLPTAVRTLLKGLAALRDAPSSFFVEDPTYPIDITTGDGSGFECSHTRASSPFLSSNLNVSQPSTTSPSSVNMNLNNDVGEKFLTVSAVGELVRSWALDDEVSPWATKLVLRLHSTNRRICNLRYSIGMDPQNLNAIAIQVHRNEPFSRELKAFPVCMLQMLPNMLCYSEVRLCYLRSLYFAKKLFDCHITNAGSFAEVSADGMLHKPCASRRRTTARAPLRTTVRPSRSQCNTRKPGQPTKRRPSKSIDGSARSVSVPRCYEFSI